MRRPNQFQNYLESAREALLTSPGPNDSVPLVAGKSTLHGGGGEGGEVDGNGFWLPPDARCNDG